MMLIGLTGNIATGKSAAALIYEKLGAEVIDADKVVHELYAKNVIVRLKLLFVFGLKVIDFRHMNVKRRELAKIVFNDREKMGKLEAVVWPYVEKEIAGHAKSKGVTIIEAALLFESGMDMKMDRTIMVCADKKLQLKRLLNRGLSKDEALRRINIQLSQKEKAKRADYVINNNSSLAFLEKEAKNIWGKLKQEFLALNKHLYTY